MWVSSSIIHLLHKVDHFIPSISLQSFSDKIRMCCCELQFASPIIHNHSKVWLLSGIPTAFSSPIQWLNIVPVQATVYLISTHCNYCVEYTLEVTVIFNNFIRNWCIWLNMPSTRHLQESIMILNRIFQSFWRAWNWQIYSNTNDKHICFETQPSGTGCKTTHVRQEIVTLQVPAH